MKATATCQPKIPHNLPGYPLVDVKHPVRLNRRSMFRFKVLIQYPLDHLIRYTKLTWYLPDTLSVLAEIQCSSPCPGIEPIVEASQLSVAGLLGTESTLDAFHQRVIDVPQS